MNARRQLPRLRSLSGWMAAGMCCSVSLLALFGYRAIREEQRGSALFSEHRRSEAADLVMRALARDMRGVQTSILQSSYCNDPAIDWPYDIGALVAGAFARYPYPESFFSWRGSPAASKIVFFARADRRPAWDAAFIGSKRFPVTMETWPAIASELAPRVAVDAKNRREVSVFETRVREVPYQVVAQMVYQGPFREHVKCGLGFLVNLDWVRRSYFPDLTKQFGHITGTRNDLRLSIADETGRAVAGATGTSAESSSRRAFPLLFVDPLVLALDWPPDLPHRNWSVGVHEDDLPLPVLRLWGANPVRTLMVAAAVAGMLALGLALASRAARGSARLAEMRSDFVSSMTHELKTPLATIRAVGDSIASGRVSTPLMLREYAQLVVQESKRLTRLVDTSLAYARVIDVADVYHFEPLDVNSLLGDALRGFASQLSAKAFQVEEDIEVDLPLVHADRTAMELLLDNLLDNAIRYSADRRWLGVRAWRQKNGYVCLAVSDKGVGIPPDEIGLVTGKFVRGRAVQSGGSGLGLAIVERIVTAHHGRISIESALGVGTSVTLTLPIASVAGGVPRTHARE